MKKLYIIIAFSAILFTACTKSDYVPVQRNPQEWMRTHEEAIVAYVDYSNGNYIVETQNGYSVIESYDITPQEYDHEYAYFSNRGTQTIYNRGGNYFTQVRIVDSWLSYSDAMYILDDLHYNNY